MELVWSEHVFIRGALTFGEAVHTANEVYGPAIIRAYELERDVAVFPRVIIDPIIFVNFETQSTLRARHHNRKSDREYLMNLITCGEDGVWFVDYLRAAQTESDDPDMYPNFIAKHKRMILRALGSQTVLTKVMHKYMWLASYHNKTVKSIGEEVWARYEIDQDNLLILQTDAPLLYLPLS